MQDAQLIELVNEDQNLLEAKTVQSARRNLVTQTARLERKIDCQLHQRSATAVCCLLTLTFGAVLSMKLRSRLYRIDLPTLLVWGDSDKLVPPAHAEAYRQGIRDAQVTQISEAGHCVIAEKPHEVAKAVISFLQ